jgi:hypothetical protein
MYAPEVDETTLCKENDMTTRGHCETVNLRLDIDSLFCISFQPGHIDLNIEMANAAGWVSRTIVFQSW